MDAARLDQLVAKVLREELREDENIREQSLEQFRDWILKNPDIRDCITDDTFLTTLLRMRKYSVPTAEQALLNILRFQQKFPSFHFNQDIDDPVINDVITSGHQFVSPFRDLNGEAVFMFVAKNLDLKKHNTVSTMRSFVLNFNALVRNETTLVLGITFIADYRQVSPAFFALYPVTMLKEMSDCLGLQQSLPGRVKKVHILNLPPVAAWFMKIMMSLFSGKLQKRFVFHSSLEELHQHVDPSVLPKEYGGTMPMDEMIGLWKKELAVHRESIFAQNNIKLVGDSFKNDLGSTDTGIPDLPGSFRTLAVD